MKARLRLHEGCIKAVQWCVLCGRVKNACMHAGEMRCSSVAAVAALLQLLQHAGEIARMHAGGESMHELRLC
jgi:hypothetical protein